MAEEKPAARRGHRHQPVTKHVLRQREGVPYEIQRRVCPQCSRILDERPVRRAAA